MKRIKIMLLAITVFAAVGGALAFKAKKNSHLWCTSISPELGGRCIILKTGFATVPAYPGQPSSGLSTCTHLWDFPCSEIPTYTND